MFPRGREKDLTQRRTRKSPVAAAEGLWQPRDFCLYCAGGWGNRCRDHANIFTIDVSRRALGGAAWPKRRVFPRMIKGGKRGAPAFEEKPRPTGICGGGGTYLLPGITLRVALRAKWVSSVTTARRRHLWESERARSGMILQALPELSITRGKHYVVVRTAQRFLAERHVGECPCRLM